MVVQRAKKTTDQNLNFSFSLPASFFLASAVFLLLATSLPTKSLKSSCVPPARPAASNFARKSASDNPSSSPASSAISTPPAFRCANTTSQSLV